MRLAVFDIDGTLTLGDGLGTRCFFSVFDELFAGGAEAAKAERRLVSYRESTDCGIAREAARRALGREATPPELDAFKSAYLQKLASEIDCRDRPYRPLPGADRFVPLLAQQPRWKVAIATGNWKGAAALKLRCARIEAPPVAAFSEDGSTRTEVLAAAIVAARAAHGCDFEQVVYLGDQVWDLEAASQAGAAFVGIGEGARALHLQRGGARVAANYLDPPLLLSMLDEAGRR